MRAIVGGAGDPLCWGIAADEAAGHHKKGAPMPRLSAIAVAFVLGGVIAVGVASPSGAQEATPVAELVTPDPALCQVAPRPPESLAAFVGTPPAGPSTPVGAAPTPFVPPAGAAADATTVAGVTATAQELFACYNANDLARVVALFTDDYLRRSFAVEGVTAEALRLFAAPPEARPAAEREAISVRDVRLLPDGRVGALLVGRNPAATPPDFTDFTVFVERDGRYLIDDVVLLPPEAVATPAP